MTDWREEADVAVRRICAVEEAQQALRDRGMDPSLMIMTKELVELRRVFCLRMAGDQEED